MIALIAFTARLAAAEANPDEVLDDDGPVTSAADSASFDPAWSDAGAADERAAARHDHPTRIGRVDLTISWRRTVRVAGMHGTLADGAHPGSLADGAGPDGAHTTYGIASPLDPVTTVRGVLWVLLTWSR